MIPWYGDGDNPFHVSILDSKAEFALDEKADFASNARSPTPTATVNGHACL